MRGFDLTPLPESRWDTSAAAHLLNRAGWGGTPPEVARLQSLGRSGAVAQLLDFQAAPVASTEPDWAHPDPDRAGKLRTLRDAPEEKRQELLREIQKENRQHLLELQYRWLKRMTQEGAPLQEKLTLFWHGHFATSAQKVRSPRLMYRQNELFRTHCAGHWPTLLDSVTRDPAMLLYLDQAESKPGHPNENYARELMELFTLGEGNFTEQDVTETARALTGLTYDRRQQEAVHRPRLRDRQPKTLFGETGDFNERDVVRVITRQPAAAPFIAAKLWQYFAGKEVAPAEAEVLGTELLRHDYQFAPFLRTVFSSCEFYDLRWRRQQIKSPVQLLVGACRQLERALPPAPIALNALRQLGQELFNPPNVKGWDGGIAWINTATLLTRHQLAQLLTTGENPLPPGHRRGNANQARLAPLRARLFPVAPAPVDSLFPAADRHSPESLVAALERRLLQSPFPAKDRTALLDFLRAQPAIDTHVVMGALRLALCTSEYQLT